MIGRFARTPAPLAVMLLVSALAACSATSTPESSGATIAAAPTAKGRYKIGKPYQIKGIWYHPRVDYEYDEVGIASWYGPGFHGETTANGEVYDMNDLTAAHKTLPMPSIVRVTNLENGRTIKVRINDRGPFVGERIIDLSRRGAQMLGFYGKGTAQVRVQIEAEESQQLAAALTGVPVAAIGAASLPASVYAPAAPPLPAPSPAPVEGDRVAVVGETAPPAPLAAEPLAPPPPPDPGPDPAPPAAVVAGEDRSPSPAHFVQAGAFADPANLAKARARLDALGPVEVKPLAVDGRALVRVRVGPLGSAAEAQKVLIAALQAGFTGSRVVVE